MVTANPVLLPTGYQRGALWATLLAREKTQREVAQQIPCAQGVGQTEQVALTLKALNRAVRYRNPLRGLIFHTDRGIEYAAGAFKARLAELGVTQSRNRLGKVTDSAYIESFFHSMKSEIYHGLHFDEDQQMRTVLREYMPFYNGARIHSSLNYVSPATCEQQVP